MLDSLAEILQINFEARKVVLYLNTELFFEELSQGEDLIIR